MSVLKKITLFLVVFVLASPLFATDPPKKVVKKAATSSDEVIAPKKNAEHRSLPSATEENEIDHIKARVAWREHNLNYPGKRIPTQAFTKASKWVEEHVQKGTLWKDVPDIQLNTPSNPFIKSAVTIPTGSWTLIGPKPIDMSTQPAGYKYGTVIGRVDAIAVDTTTVTPGSIVAYAGSPSGGLWKTTNCCSSSSTWTPIWDNYWFAAQAVGAIEIDPNNHNIIYAGTGDFDAADDFGEGIMKSTDGGSTWTQLAADVFAPYTTNTPIMANQNVGQIKVNPSNSNTIFVGTRFDLFVSNNAGVNWTRCGFGANPTNPVSGVLDGTTAINRITGIYLDSTGNNMYVAVGHNSSTFNGNNGVYKGTIPTSGCPTLTLMNNNFPANTGNGTNGINGGSTTGRIRLAASRGNGTNSLTLYAQVAASTASGCRPSKNNPCGGTLGTWVTTNGGTNWLKLPKSVDSEYPDCTGSATGDGQDWYDLFIVADPTNDKVLYIGRTDLYKATVTSGPSPPAYTDFECVTNCGGGGPKKYVLDLSNVYATGCSSYGSTHPDQHVGLWVSALSKFLAGNDGGIYLADGTVGGFTQMNSTVNNTQWYAGQTGANIATGTQYFFAGAQDNGNASWHSTNTNTTWQARSNGGDGFFVAFDPIAANPLTGGSAITEYTFGSMSRSTAGISGTYSNSVGCQSGNCNWSTPLKMDQFHCSDASCGNVLYGDIRPLATVNGGANWSFDAPVGTDVTKGTVAGVHGTVASLDIAYNKPTSAVLGTDDGNVAWSNNWLADDSGNGKLCTQAASNKPSFGCVANASATWVELQSGTVLPNRVMNGVTLDPTNDQKIYAAVGGFDDNTTSTPGHIFQGVCTTTCTTAANWTWSNKTGNLPDVPAESIVINPYNANQAFLGTDFGFFYTENINATTPVWYQYQYGLPNTMVKFLTIDRGASVTPLSPTTLTAFTYGRGTYAIRLPGSSGASTYFPPHPVPTLYASKSGANVSVTYDTSQCSQNADHNIYWGNIGNFTAVTGGACGVGNSGNATAAVPAGSWYVITGTDSGNLVASFGTDSSGSQRVLTGWSALCSESTQNAVTTCP